MKASKKLSHLPPYIFAQIDQLVHEKIKQGEDLFVLSKSDPDHPTHPDIVAELQKQAALPENHHYPDFDGLSELRQGVADWYVKKFGVELNPDTEVLPLLGSKEGIVHFCEAWLDQGDIALVPDPAFPSYKTGTILAEGQPYLMPLQPPDFLPNFKNIPPDIAKKAKVMFLNYPNNPTGATASLKFWQEALSFAQANDIILINDHAYSMTCFVKDGAPSLLSLPGSRERCLEFLTFSKAFHMAGWRLGAAVGNPDILEGLKIIETHVNAGVFNPIQFAGAAALKLGLKENFFAEDNQSYRERLKVLVDFFNNKGWNLTVPEATVYLWVPAPENMTGEEFTHFLLDKAHVVVSPGNAFGEEGQNYVRICVTYSTEVVEKAVEAMDKAFETYKIIPPNSANNLLRRPPCPSVAK